MKYLFIFISNLSNAQYLSPFIEGDNSYFDKSIITNSNLAKIDNDIEFNKKSGFYYYDLGYVFGSVYTIENIEFDELKSIQTNKITFILNSIFNNDIKIRNSNESKKIFFDSNIFNKKFELRRQYGMSKEIPKDTLEIWMRFNSSLGEFKITDKYVSYLKCNNNVFQNKVILNNRFLGNSTLEYTSFLGGLSFSGSSFYAEPIFRNLIIKDSLNFSKVNFNFPNSKNLIDLRNFSLYSPEKKCKLIIDFFNTDRFIIPYNNFEMVFPEEFGYEQKTNFYESVISNCKELGMFESSQAWDIEFKTLEILYKYPTMGSTIVFVNKYWWNFGYDKWLILVKWLPIFFLVFLSINIIFIKTLYENVYRDNELGEAFFDKKLKKYFKAEIPSFSDWRFRITYCIFYTSSIYFGFKLKHSSINYRNFGGMMYVFLMYSFGSIQIAFALSYILGIY